jgi:putative ABC transport system substrate-binding protein
MTHRIIELLVSLALALLVMPFAAEVRQSGEKPRIGFLSPVPSNAPTTTSRNFEAFRQGLRELGYIEGQHLTLEYREAPPDRLAERASELVRLPVDVLVTWSMPAIQAAQQATTTILIVMGASGDPIQTGFVASLARLGGNITGLTILPTELTAKRPELLTQLVPSLSRVAVLWNPANPAMVLEWQEAQAAAHRLGVQVQSLEIRGSDEFARAFAAATLERAQALYFTAEGLFTRHLPQILDFAARIRLPTSFHRREFVEAGGLMSYAAYSPDRGRRVAVYVDKILKGAKPGDLPVEQPMQFELVINLKTAQALGLTVPPTLLLEADKVIR